MGKSLREYAELHPHGADPIEQSSSSKSYRDIRSERAEADHLKQIIAKQIRDGEQPQLILYGAVKCIEILTNDPDFGSECREQLDRICGDLAQQSLLYEENEIERERIRQIQEEAKERTKRSIGRQLAAYRGIEKDLVELLAKIDGIKEEAEG